MLTGVSKSGFGAGMEMLAVPALALFILPQTAAAIMLPILVAMDLANFWRYRRDWVKRILVMLVPAALVGILIGAAMFNYLDGEKIKFGIGILALVFVAQRFLMSAEKPKKPPKWLTLMLGATGGFTSFVAHAGSAPIKIILLSEDLPKQQFVGTNSYLFGSINLIKCVPYFALGQFSTENLWVSASLAPFILIGVLMGFWLNGIVSQLWFTRIVFTALFFAGVKLTYDGLAALF